MQHLDLTWTMCVMKQDQTIWVGLDCFKAPQMLHVAIEASCQLRVAAGGRIHFLQKYPFQFRHIGGVNETPTRMWRTCRRSNLTRAPRLFIVAMDLFVIRCDVFWMHPNNWPMRTQGSNVVEEERNRPNSVADDFRQQVLQSLVQPAPPLLDFDPSVPPPILYSPQPPPELQMTSTSTSQEPGPSCSQPTTRSRAPQNRPRAKCPMCQDAEAAVRIQCGHDFCLSCIRREINCPTCAEEEAKMEKTVNDSFKDLVNAVGRLLDDE